MSQTNNNLNNIAASLAKNKLLMDCYQNMQTNNLVLPTIPDACFKIRRAINVDNSNISSIARIVQIDPSITARLIQISNSSLYAGRKKIESCPEAMTRLGLKAAQDIITAFALKSVFSAKSPVIRKKMAELWEHSSYIASISAVFAHKIPGFDPDRAMLAGLVHDIGIVPILTYADNHPDVIANPKDLVETVKELRAAIGVQIIRQWDFPSDFEDVVINAENWFRNNDNPSSYADIVMISQIYSFIGKVDIKKIPKINDLPAYRKLAGHLDADDAINMLDAVKDEIGNVRKMLE
ncbi:MAG: HDOD domain-containing protein [Methylobacter sp.]|uniref:HDOD domain-containing protein n=1 Tax=Methylobacter sp. TaxID=2051955 RepID=UPI0025CF6309|nr:HDOD domain-containing protein [Methylobacter sp.]MCK9619902.1 HDOD domain-containing protein [Methylobacter sp.]